MLLPPIEREFLVVCLCADWCGTCREYRPGFEALANDYPDAGFIWVDIEACELDVQHWPVENFPTILIQRDESVLFFGAMLPHQAILRKTLEAYKEQPLSQSIAYSRDTKERLSWQSSFNYRALTKLQD